MPKSKPPYPAEFRTEAIRLARTSGRPRSAIARDLGLTPETLRIWLKQDDLDEGRRSDGMTTEERFGTAAPPPREPSRALRSARS